LSLLFRETPVYKASSEKIGPRNGEEKISLIASSLRMAADPEYLLSGRERENLREYG
jgi:hypothetical protein